MRDPERIYPFLMEFAEIWRTKAPDWRFGQIFMNLPFEKDPFYYEEDEFISLVKEFFERNENGTN